MVEVTSWYSTSASASAVLSTLPMARPRPAEPVYTGGHRAVTLPRALTEQLKALGQRDDATLYMTLLAAFQVLLARHAGQDDIVVGFFGEGAKRLLASSSKRCCTSLRSPGVRSRSSTIIVLPGRTR